MAIDGLGAYRSAYAAGSGAFPSGNGADADVRAASETGKSDGSARGESTARTDAAEKSGATDSGRAGNGEKKSGTGATTDSLTLSEEAKALVRELKSRDAEVRAHEQAHMAAGGGLTGAASYSYETGPDGKRYAVGGEVSIDSGAVSGDPRATIAKMATVKAAAMAPANPSAQDRAVAASAAATSQQAQQELTLTMTGPQRVNPYAQSADPATSRAVSQFIGVA